MGGNRARVEGMLDFVFAAGLGAIIGFAAGIVPGFHANNIALLALWVAGSESIGIGPLPISVIVVSAGVAHAFSSFIPSIFLGAPSEETALTVSPGHRMLLLGKGFHSLVLCVSGGLFGVVAVLVSFFLLKEYVLPSYELVKQYLGTLLVLVSGAMIFMEKRKSWALLIFALSGAYGIVSLNSGINERYVLLPVLAGLFGASTLIVSCHRPPKIPVQSLNASVRAKDAVHGAFAGFLGGALAGFLPGVGASQSALIAQRVCGIKGTKKFMVAIGAIGASDVLLSVFALALIGRTRSGIAAAAETLLGNIGFPETLLFLGAGLLAAGAAAVATIKAGRVFAKNASLHETRRTSVLVLMLLLTLCALFTGILGVFVFLVGATIGILPQATGTKKSILMACLLVPTTLYFTGTDMYLLGYAGL